jgi:hypothetical protein
VCITIIINLLVIVKKALKKRENRGRKQHKTGDLVLDNVVLAAALDTGSPRLITVDELRAAGALDVPAAWGRSLGGGQRDLFSDIVEHDDPHSEEEKAKQSDLDRDDSADERE